MKTIRTKILRYWSYNDHLVLVPPSGPSGTSFALAAGPSAQAFVAAWAEGAREYDLHFRDDTTKELIEAVPIREDTP